MPRIFRTLVVCSLLIVGAASPAVAAAQSHDGAAAAQGIHTTGAPDGHTP